MDENFCQIFGAFLDFIVYFLYFEEVFFDSVVSGIDHIVSLFESISDNSILSDDFF